MRQAWIHVVTPWLTPVALLCWAVMFMAGTDVWHYLGRPDIWNQQGPPYADVRAFVYAFYLLLVVLFVNLILTAAHKRRTPRLVP